MLCSGRFFFSLAYTIFYKVVDKGIIELLGPFGIVLSIQNALFVQQTVQTGLVYHYAGYILLCIICVTHMLVDNVSIM